MAEFSFPSATEANLIFKLDGSQNGDSASHSASTTHRGQGSVTSRDISAAPPTPTRCHFDMSFSQPFAARHVPTTAGQRPGLHPQASTLSATRRGPMQLPPTAPTGAPDPAGTARLPRQAAAGLCAASRTSPAPVGAYVNITSRPPCWPRSASPTSRPPTRQPTWPPRTPAGTSPRSRAAAQRSWNALLGKIADRRRHRAQQAVFYTALYHSLLHPNVFSDDNGQYPGVDGEGAHRRLGPVGAATPTSPAGTSTARRRSWRRCVDPAAASGRRAVDGRRLRADRHAAQVDAEDNGETYVMVGDPADPIIADYYAFGATGFNTSAALTA